MALVIALLGLVLSVVSLGWQIAQHFLSGPRVQAELRWGGLGSDRAVTGPIKGTLNSFAYAGVEFPIFAIQGRNHGRSSIEVTGFFVEMDGAGSYSLPGWRHNPSLPHRLDPGSEVSFYIPLADVEAAVKAFGSSFRGRVRGRLDLASGRHAVGAWTSYPPKQ